MASKNPSPVLDVDAWARRTSAKLRLIHTSFADQGFDQKRLYLEDEIEFALNDAGAVDQEQRRELLERLSGCFPVFSESAPAAVPFVTTHQAKVEPVEQLVELWSKSGSEQRERISFALAAAGITAPAAPAQAMPAEIPERVILPSRPEEIDDFARGVDQLWRELNAPAAALDFNRTLKLLGMLASMMKDLHKFVWEFWRQTAPRNLHSVTASGFSEPFERVVAAYLRAEDGSSSRDLAMEIEKSKRLMLGICVAVRKGAEEFARSHHQVFSPENIENAVTLEETVGDSSRVRELGRKSWEKYCQLSKNMTPDSVDHEFQRVFSSVIASMLRARG